MDDLDDLLRRPEAAYRRGYTQGYAKAVEDLDRLVESVTYTGEALSGLSEFYERELSWGWRCNGSTGRREEPPRLAPDEDLGWRYRCDTGLRVVR